MRPRIPLAYVGLLIIALVAVVGFAAFSPSPDAIEETSAASILQTDEAALTVSARVASAVLALRVSAADNRTGTTQISDSGDPAQTSTEAAGSSDSKDAAGSLDSEADEPEAGALAEPTEARDTTPPAFEISSPKNGDTVTSRVVTFSGTVEKGATVRSGPYEATVTSDGSWSIALAVVAGANGASFTASDAAGNTSSARIVVEYDAPDTTTTAAPATKTTTAPATTSTTSATPTTAAPTSSKWSPNWPADSGGRRNVETWRPLVARYWASDRVDCVLGIILRESGGDPTAYNSSSGASGLMQHLIKYWDGRAAGAGFKDSSGRVASPYNAEANIAAGAHIAGSGSNWYTPWSRLPDYGTCLDS